MRVLSFVGLLFLGVVSLRCDGGSPESDGLGGADGSGGSDGSGGTASGGTASGGGSGGSGDCESQNCCLAQESYCDGDEIWEGPLDPECTEEPELRETCPYGCAVSTLYQFAYCEDAPEGGAGGLGGMGGS